MRQVNLPVQAFPNAMKKTFAFALAFGAAIAFAGCNTQETHDRGLEKPAGTETGPEDGADARQQRGDEPNESGDKTAADHAQ